MNASFQRIAAALAADAALRERVMAASTLDERSAILAEAGLTVPNAEEIADRVAGLDRANGGHDAWLMDVGTGFSAPDVRGDGMPI